MSTLPSKRYPVYLEAFTNLVTVYQDRIKGAEQHQVIYIRLREALTDLNLPNNTVLTLTPDYVYVIIGFRSSDSLADIQRTHKTLTDAMLSTKRIRACSTLTLNDFDKHLHEFSYTIRYNTPGTPRAARLVYTVTIEGLADYALAREETPRTYTEYNYNLVPRAHLV
jgi:hypothetical protein